MGSVGHLLVPGAFVIPHSRDRAGHPVYHPCELEQSHTMPCTWASSSAQWQSEALSGGFQLSWTLENQK